jgi:transposase
MIFDYKGIANKYIQMRPIKLISSVAFEQIEQSNVFFFIPARGFPSQKGPSPRACAFRGGGAP